MPFQLTSEESQFIDGLVAAGTFASSEDAVREGVRLLMSREKFRSELSEAVEDLDAGNRIPAADMFAELRTRASARLVKSRNAESFLLSSRAP